MKGNQKIDFVRGRPFVSVVSARLWFTRRQHQRGSPKKNIKSSQGPIDFVCIFFFGRHQRHLSPLCPTSFRCCFQLEIKKQNVVSVYRCAPRDLSPPPPKKKQFVVLTLNVSFAYYYLQVDVPHTHARAPSAEKYFQFVSSLSNWVVNKASKHGILQLPTSNYVLPHLPNNCDHLVLTKQKYCSPAQNVV